MSLDEFRAKLGQYRRALGVTQKQLAHELGLNPTVLSHKLNETDDMRLTYLEAKAIVKLLARWQAISRRSQAVELLGLMNLKPNAFTDAEWASPPLSSLEADTSPVQASAPAALVATPSPPDTLPTPVTPLIGREALVASLHERLSDPQVRLLTLTGAGGIGKTRLALELAQISRDRFPDGVVFIPLTGIADWTLVAVEIAHRFQIKGASGTAMIDALKASLAQRDMLLILDNFEHVLEAAPLVAELLQASARLTILVTSRVVLNLYGEHQVRVPPLELPNLREAAAPAQLIRQPAVALFVARSKAARHDFTLTDANAAAIAQICVRLDGLPLALELAAARCRLFSPAALLQRLDQPLELLSGGASNAAPHQRTLRDTIAWSYTLLDPAEQGLFRIISAFPGGCSIEALEAVFVPPAAATRSLLDLVTSLLDKSLIDQRDLPGDEPHFRMLETLREFGIDLLLEADEWDRLRERQTEFYVRWLEATAPDLTGAAQLQTAALIEREHDNIRAVLTWAVPTRPLPAVRLIGILGPFWNLRGYSMEGLRWASLVLESVDILALENSLKSTYAKAFNSSGALAFATGDYDRANLFLQRALNLRLEIEDSEGIAATYNNLGNLAWNRSDLHTARQYFESGAQMAEEIENYKLLASILNNLGTLLSSLNDLPLAQQTLFRALEIWRGFGNKQSIANTLSNLGGIALRQQHFDQAMTYFVESLALQRELGNKRNAGAVLANMGEIALRRGDFTEAQSCFEQTLTLQREVDYLWGVGSALCDLGRVAFYQGQFGTAFARLQESLSILRPLNDYIKLALITEYLGITALRMKDSVGALAYLHEALRLNHEMADEDGTASTLACIAAAMVIQGDLPRAVRLWGAAFHLWEQSGAQILPSERLLFNDELESARANLNPADFEAAWQQGASLPLPEILAEVD